VTEVCSDNKYVNVVPECTQLIENKLTGVAGENRIAPVSTAHENIVDRFPFVANSSCE